MPYRVQRDGTVECDTPDEAIALSDRLTTQLALFRELNQGVESAAGAATPKPPSAKPKPQARPLADVVREMTDQQRKALEFIKVMGFATLDDLREELALKESPFSVSGVISAVVRNLEGAGIDTKDVLSKQVSGSGKDRVVTYYPTKLLQELGEEAFK